MKAVSLIFTGVVLLANNISGAEIVAPIFFEPDFLEERNLSMRYLKERNLSMRYLRDRNLSMRYLAFDKSDNWGRSLSEAEKAKLSPIVEDTALLWERRNLSMRYLNEKRVGKARRLRVAGK
jgi:hypothetical protein